MTSSTSTPPPLPIDRVISFSAEINPHTTESLIAVLANYANEGAKHVCLLLSTPGGSVMHGLNLFNVMKAMPFHLTVHNVGNVDSIGNAIFLAGDTRYACKHSTFMFHGVGFSHDGARLEEKRLKEMLGGIHADQRRIGSILVERTQITEDEATSLFLEAQTKDADYAVSHGIIDEIRDVEIPQGVPVQSLVFQR